MNFELSDEQRMIRDMVSDFAEEVIKPRAIEIDKTGEFPSDIFKKMGELGFMGLPFSEKYGGSGGDTLSYILAVEEIGKRCGSTGLSYAAAVSLGASPLYYLLAIVENCKLCWNTCFKYGRAVFLSGKPLYYFGNGKPKEEFFKPLYN